MRRRMRRAGLRGKLLLSGSAVLLLGLLAASPASAAPPANDNFAAAQTISGTSVNVAGTNFQATKQTGEPNHAGDPGGASVWYLWTAPSSGAYELDTCGGNVDTLLAVYTGTAVNALTQVASNDQGFHCGDQSELAFRAVSGTTYHFAVDGWSEGGSAPPSAGAFSLHLQLAPAPANDNFASAQAIPSQTENDVEGGNLAATKQTGEPNHGGDAGGASVWYSLVAPVSGRMQIDVCFSDFESLLAVYTGSAVNSLTPVADSSDDCGLEFNAVAGTTYRIAVDGFSNGGAQPAGAGSFFLETHLFSPPVNDNFASAQVLTGSIINVSGDNIDATSEPGEPTGFADGPLQSVWYAWTAPASGQLAIDTCQSNFDTVLTLFAGSALNGLSRIASNDDAQNCGFGGSKLIVNVNAGTSYRIAVDGYFDAGSFQLRLLLSGAAVAQKDSKAPNAKITKVKVDSEHGKAKVTFGSSEAGSKYKCKLDKSAYKSCHSPKTFRHLDQGKHKVKVKATDAAGNTDPTPAVKKFKI